MAKKYAKRNGILPSAEVQAAIGLAQADIAYRTAKAQGRKMVDPAVAAQHAVDVATAVPMYLIFILPITVVTLIAPWTLDPFMGAWRIAHATIGIVIGLRLIRWVQEPATNRLVYRIPTLALVIVGGINVFLFSLAAVAYVLTA